MSSRFVRVVAVTTAVVVLVALLGMGAVWAVDYTVVGRQASATPQIPAGDPGAPLPDAVNVRTTEMLVGEPGVTLVDVRTPSEFASGHIDGAVNIPLDDLAERMDEVPSDGTVVTVCRSGSRSDTARRALVEAGWGNVHGMSGGMRAWRRAGFAVTESP